MPSPFADVAPKLAAVTDEVLFGDVWERPGLSPRDRSLITVATLIALYRANELPFHLKKAIDNGITRDELAEVITHLAFYAGWPPEQRGDDRARRLSGERNLTNAARHRRHRRRSCPFDVPPDNDHPRSHSNGIERDDENDSGTVN